jgi:hypothetical protein
MHVGLEVKFHAFLTKMAEKLLCFESLRQIVQPHFSYVIGLELNGSHQLLVYVVYAYRAKA